MNLIEQWFKPIADHAAATARLMVGVPDYDKYVAHMRSQHPDQPALTYAAFFRARQDARYGAGQARCC